MKQLTIIFALVLLGACNSNGAPRDAAAEPNVVVKIVDQQRNAVKAEKVTWWYLNERGTRHTLDCAEHKCAEWAVGKEAAGSIAITAYASKVKANDEYCWDMYEGEAVITADPAVPQQVVIALSKTVTACK